jgi:hypothetical protein
MHSEVLLMTFAKDSLIREGAILRLLKGCVSENDEVRSILQRDARWKRGVAFCVEI